MKAVMMSLAIWIVSSPGAVFCQERFPVFLEATIGVSQGGTTGQYVEERVAGRAVDVLIGVPAVSVAGGAAVLAVAASAHGRGDYQDVCLITPTGCAPPFPRFQAAAALIGVQSSGGGLRVLVGPAAARGESPREVSKDVFAWAGRLEGSARLHRHAALVASLRALLVPDYDGDRFHMMAFGVGLRLM